MYYWNEVIVMMFIAFVLGGVTMVVFTIIFPKCTGGGCKLAKSFLIISSAIIFSRIIVSEIFK